MAEDMNDKSDHSDEMFEDYCRTIVYCETWCPENFSISQREYESPTRYVGARKDLTWNFRLIIVMSGTSDECLDCLAIQPVRINNKSAKPVRLQFQMSILGSNDQLFYSQSFTVFVKATEQITMPNYLDLGPLDNLPRGRLRIHSNVSLNYEVENSRWGFGMRQLSKDLESLFRDQKHCDVTLMVKEKQFPAHKSMLASRSPVFAAMFEHDMTEKRASLVNITDLEGDIFEDFLLFLYTGKSKFLEDQQFEWKSVGNLLSAADKYDVPVLKTMCADCLKLNTCVDNACEIFSLAHNHNVGGLKKFAMDFINANAHRVIDTDGWSVIKASSNLLTELYVANFRKTN